MAAFPPPTLDLHLDYQFRELMYHLHSDFVGWYRTHSLTVVVALDQFETMLTSVRRHAGPVRLHGEATANFQSPHDCLTSFAGWRRQIAEALVRIPGFFDPRWLTGDVVELRDAIAAGRAFDRLPILADALEEAGCDNQLVLTHLRDGGDHAHHCWVVDLLTFGGTG